LKAEEVKNAMNKPKKQVVKSQGGGGGGKSKGNGGDGKGEEKDEDDELKKALDGVIVKEKPDIKFSDVAGLENAKRAL